ncbi:MAG: hypothetical protein RLZ98_2955 [Pseudomonadota bacterium]|jgi:hypothetical protein
MSDGSDDDGVAGPEGEEKPDGEAASTFGSCCDELKEALAAHGFEPFISVGDDGVLYMSVGEVLLEGEQHNYVDHPIFFCPFCGTSLQSRDEIMARLTGGGDAPAGSDSDGE